MEQPIPGLYRLVTLEDGRVLRLMEVLNREGATSFCVTIDFIPIASFKRRFAADTWVHSEWMELPVHTLKSVGLR